MAFFVPLITSAAAAAKTAAPFIGMGMTALGGIQQYRGTQAAGQAAASAAEYNARMAQQQGQQRAGLIRGQGQRQLASTRALIGKSGATSAGTPLMVLAESAANVEIDAMNAMWSANQEASLSRVAGRNARRESSVRAGTSLLTTASKLF